MTKVFGKNKKRDMLKMKLVSRKTKISSAVYSKIDSIDSSTANIEAKDKDYLEENKVIFNLEKFDKFFRILLLCISAFLNKFNMYSFS